MMKKIKKFTIGGGRSVIALFLLLVLASIGAFAYDAGDTVHFKHTLSGSYDVFTTSDGFVGCCAELGKPSDDEGTATIKAPKALTKKIAYHYGVELNWHNSKESYNGWVLTKGEMLQNLIRASEMGWGDFSSNFGSFYDALALPETQTLYEGASSLDNPPNGFECWYCDQGTVNQNFVIWKFNETGKLKLKKASANTSITG